MPLVGPLTLCNSASSTIRSGLSTATTRIATMCVCMCHRRANCFGGMASTQEFRYVVDPMYIVHNTMSIPVMSCFVQQVNFSQEHQRLRLPILMEGTGIHLTR